MLKSSTKRLIKNLPNKGLKNPLVRKMAADFHRQGKKSVGSKMYRAAIKGN